MQAERAFFDLLLVALEELHEAGLRSGRSFDAAEPEFVYGELDVFKIELQVLEPKRGALADGRELRGLQVREAQSRHLAVLVREGGQGFHDVHQMVGNEFQGIPVDDEVGVVGDVAAGGAEMDYAGRALSLVAVGLDVSHDVVAHFSFVFFRDVEIDVGRVFLQFLNLLFSYGESQFAFLVG